MFNYTVGGVNINALLLFMEDFFSKEDIEVYQTDLEECMFIRKNYKWKIEVANKYGYFSKTPISDQLFVLLLLRLKILL